MLNKTFRMHSFKQFLDGQSPDTVDFAASFLFSQSSGFPIHTDTSSWGFQIYTPWRPFLKSPAFVVVNAGLVLTEDQNEEKNKYVFSDLPSLM